MGHPPAVVRLVILATVDQLARAQRHLAAIPGAAEQAMARALNRAATAGRQAAVESITERYAVNASDVRSKITLTAARPDSLGVMITARSPSLSLTYFPHTPTRAGTGGPGRPVLRAEIRRGESKAIPGAFIATINGKPKIMIRTGGKTKAGKQAIRSATGVPIAVMLGAVSVRAAVEERALEVLDARLGHEIDRALAGAA